MKIVKVLKIFILIFVLVMFYDIKAISVSYSNKESVLDPYCNSLTNKEEFIYSCTNLISKEEYVKTLLNESSSASSFMYNEKKFMFNNVINSKVSVLSPSGLFDEIGINENYETKQSVLINREVQVSGNGIKANPYVFISSIPKQYSVTLNIYGASIKTNNNTVAVGGTIAFNIKDIETNYSTKDMYLKCNGGSSIIFQNNQIIVSYVSSNDTCIAVLSRTFAFTGNKESYKTPLQGNYEIIASGAQGNAGGGKGGKISGEISLNKNSNLDIYVGGVNGWGYGGNGGNGASSNPGTNGGGSSIVRYNSQNIIVAAGGGGGASGTDGGNGTGNSGTTVTNAFENGAGSGQNGINGGGGGAGNTYQFCQKYRLKSCYSKRPNCTIGYYCNSPEYVLNGTMCEKKWVKLFYFVCNVFCHNTGYLGAAYNCAFTEVKPDYCRQGDTIIGGWPSESGQCNKLNTELEYTDIYYYNCKLTYEAPYENCCQEGEDPNDCEILFPATYNSGNGGSNSTTTLQNVVNRFGENSGNGSIKIIYKG